MAKLGSITCMLLISALCSLVVFTCAGGGSELTARAVGSESFLPIRYAASRRKLLGQPYWQVSCSFWLYVTYPTSCQYLVNTYYNGCFNTIAGLNPTLGCDVGYTVMANSYICYKGTANVNLDQSFFVP
eukprot:TRINITY_DN133_c0_g1_i1.p1 TRINITY_DN133_c0_g1~~TRINITY_DN133_c0_g1_i1.p1  ORF type:complete len:138 (+),score=7.34 TRINITY_DN133_c0_g1_i1:29-415(+)